jgi:hypothetical protein
VAIWSQVDSASRLTKFYRTSSAVADALSADGDGLICDPTTANSGRPEQ